MSHSRYKEKVKSGLETCSFASLMKGDSFDGCILVRAASTVDLFEIVSILLPTFDWSGDW